jgi:hypothetical protein
MGCINDDLTSIKGFPRFIDINNMNQRVNGIKTKDVIL